VSVDTLDRSWAKPVLEQMGLAQAPAIEGFLNDLRLELEKSRFLDKVRSTVSQINHEAGHQIIESQEFLPPARLVSRLRFSRRGTDYCLEIAVRPEGPKAVFYTVKKLPRGLHRIFNNNSTNRISTFYKLFFRPDAVGKDDVQSWCTYLVSEFKPAFKPVADAYSKAGSCTGGINSPVGVLSSL
jgi:hypothetical protein